MLTYILQVIFFQVLFLGVYDIFLSKETFFSKNRWYLLSTTIVSFILPFIKLRKVQQVVPETYTILLPEIVLSPEKVIEEQHWYQSVDYLDIIFWCGVIIFFIVFLLKLYKIVRLIFKHRILKKEGYTLVLLPKNAKAFSFFNFIFIGAAISEDKRAKIIQHELVHSQQKHTLDLLFFEFLKIGMWFNPMLYLYQKRITLVHEFLSDEVASNVSEKSNYINSLLSEIFQVEQISFINQFYKKSLIKKRIRMITKNRSKQIKQLKYLLLVPVIGSMLLYTACSNNEGGATTPELYSQRIYAALDKEPVITDNKTYLDLYMASKPPSTKEVQFESLSSGEQQEFSKFENQYKEKGSSVVLKVYEGPQNRKLIAVDMNELAKEYKKSKKESDACAFSDLDVSPTFPGCEDGDKDCFNKSMREFVIENFESSLAKSLDLEKTKYRIYVQFKITKEGKIADIEARAPHEALKNHAIEIVEKLPVMKAGEKDGKKVNVSYILPMSFAVN